MKGLAPLFLGIFGTFAFSWVGLTVLPNWQIGHLNPQSDEEGTDIYPQPQSGMFERGAHVYAANGCVYCHSQQVRADYAGADIERGWGNRRSAPRDYIFERPVFLAKMRMGQDIANIGARAPAEQQSPAPAGAVSPAASPGGATSPAASAAPRGGVPAAPPATQGAAASPGAVASAKAVSPPATQQSASPSAAGSPVTAVVTSAAASPASSAPRYRRHLLRRPVLLRHRQEQWQMQALERRPLHHPGRRPQDLLGQSKRLASLRCTPRPGITCISIRRAASTSTRICLHIVSSMKSAASVINVQLKL